MDFPDAVSPEMIPSKEPLSPEATIDELSSDYDEEEYERFQAERPFKLREKGNEQYAQSHYEEAIRFWMLGLKETLKRSVRTPSAALYQNQVRVARRDRRTSNKLRPEPCVFHNNAVPFSHSSLPIQITCRLNMAMGYLKLGEWVEAKEQAELVLEQRPGSVKALYRMALALEKLQVIVSVFSRQPRGCRAYRNKK